LRSPAARCSAACWQPTNEPSKCWAGDAALPRPPSELGVSTLKEWRPSVATVVIVWFPSPTTSAVAHVVVLSPRIQGTRAPAATARATIIFATSPDTQGKQEGAALPRPKNVFFCCRSLVDRLRSSARLTMRFMYLPSFACFAQSQVALKQGSH